MAFFRRSVPFFLVYCRVLKVEAGYFEKFFYLPCRKGDLFVQLGFSITSIREAIFSELMRPSFSRRSKVAACQS